MPSWHRKLVICRLDYKCVSPTNQQCSLGAELLLNNGAEA
jgi:hypothetical protein